MTRLGTRLKGSGMMLKLDNKMSSSITTMLLGGTVNGGLAYVFMSRNVLHGGRFGGMLRSCRYLKLGMVKISTDRGFFDRLTNIRRPRGGHGVVNGNFVSMFSRRTRGVGSIG